MKKTMVRIVAALLVAMLALTLLPMGAFAMEDKDGEYVYVDAYAFDKNGLNVENMWDHYVDYYGQTPYKDGSTIKVSDYDDLFYIGDDLYDFKGFSTAYSDMSKAVNKYIEENYSVNGEVDWGNVDYDKVNAYADSIMKNINVNFVKSDLNIPKLPTPPNTDNADAWDAYNKAIDNWYKNWSSTILAGYTPHQHNLSRWYSDGTTHWKECLTCKKYLGMYNQFMYQNWCQDGDEDGICNVCGGDVPYHDITVIEEEGGKITVNRDNACHRMKITADVEPAEGYKLKKLHFTKIRDDGSEQEITRYKKNGQFWTYMPTYELEVSAEFVKVKTKK